MPAIQTHELTKQFGETTAVDGLDLQVEDGEVFGFLGPNGAGKSTTINVLLGFTTPTTGSAEVLGTDPQREPAQLRKRLGVLPEGFDLYDRLSGRKHVQFAIDMKDASDEPGALLERVGLEAADRDRSVGEYSTGMKQRLALAMALAGDPDLLVLDEPSTGLDPTGMQDVRDIVDEEVARGTTVFFSSHILGQVEAVCDRVGIMQAGDLVAVDSIQGLREAAGAESTFELSVDQTPEDVGFDDIEGIEESRVANGTVRVTCTDPRAKSAAVRRVEDAGVTVVDIDSVEASLEDLFTAYTTSNGDAPEVRS